MAASGSNDATRAGDPCGLPQARCAWCGLLLRPDRAGAGHHGDLCGACAVQLQGADWHRLLAEIPPAPDAIVRPLGATGASDQPAAARSWGWRRSSAR